MYTLWGWGISNPRHLAVHQPALPSTRGQPRIDAHQKHWGGSHWLTALINLWCSTTFYSNVHCCAVSQQSEFVVWFSIWGLALARQTLRAFFLRVQSKYKPFRNRDWHHQCLCLASVVLIILARSPHQIHRGLSRVSQCCLQHAALRHANPRPWVPQPPFLFLHRGLCYWDAPRSRASA